MRIQMRIQITWLRFRFISIPIIDIPNSDSNLDADYFSHNNANYIDSHADSLK